MHILPKDKDCRWQIAFWIFVSVSIFPQHLQSSRTLHLRPTAFEIRLSQLIYSPSGKRCVSLEKPEIKWLPVQFEDAVMLLPNSLHSMDFAFFRSSVSLLSALPLILVQLFEIRLIETFRPSILNMSTWRSILQYHRHHPQKISLSKVWDHHFSRTGGKLTSSTLAATLVETSPLP